MYEWRLGQDGQWHSKNRPDLTSKQVADKMKSHPLLSFWMRDMPCDPGPDVID